MKIGYHIKLSNDTIEPYGFADLGECKHEIRFARKYRGMRLLRIVKRTQIGTGHIDQLV